MKQIREGLDDEQKSTYRDSMETPLLLLQNQMRRLSLKAKKFQTFGPAEEESIDAIWNECLEVDKTLLVIILFSSCAVSYCTRLKGK